MHVKNDPIVKINSKNTMRPSLTWILSYVLLLFVQKMFTNKKAYVPPSRPKIMKCFSLLLPDYLKIHSVSSLFIS